MANETNDEQLPVDEAAEKEKKYEMSKMTAKLMTRPSFMAAHTSSSFIPESMKVYGANIVTMNEEYRDRCKAVVDGDMTHPEALLIAQAMSLNSIYNWCAELAAANVGKSLSNGEGLMRMALKAQAQCTQTLRVLGELKNPRQGATFVKQQNNATTQQVNNAPVTQGTPAHAHGEKETQTTTNELLTIKDDREAQHAATLDTGATRSASGEDPQMETVGAVDGADD